MENNRKNVSGSSSHSSQMSESRGNLKPHGNDERSREVVHSHEVFQENDGPSRLSGVLTDKVSIEHSTTHFLRGSGRR